MITVKNVSKSYEVLTVLSGVSFALGSGHKAALVGSNGVGKSTLLKIIAGFEEADSGTIEISQDAFLGYLPQEVEMKGEEVVEEYLKRITGIGGIEEGMRELAFQLQEKDKLEAYSNLQNIYAKLNGYTFKHRMEVVLEGFELRGVENRTLSSLSGGQKSKVALSGILLKGVDILLLDEPTNNLDIPALIWLENFLLRSSATCLIVSMTCPIFSALWLSF